VPRTTSGGGEKARADAKGAPKPGRAASGSATPGRVTPKPGRYTPPIPKDRRRSPAWYPVVLLFLLILGLLMIVLNYVHVLPGGTSNWYLIGGIAAIIVGLTMATFYH
jgi:hypothetical protein